VVGSFLPDKNPFDFHIFLVLSPTAFSFYFPRWIICRLVDGGRVGIWKMANGSMGPEGKTYRLQS
jgi:hypothetical protein